MNEMQASKIADEFLDGLDYPVSKAEIMRRAREGQIAAPVQEALEKLPDREYADSEDLTRSLNAAP